MSAQSSNRSQAIAETPVGLNGKSDIPRIEVTEPSPLIKSESSAVSGNAVEPEEVVVVSYDSAKQMKKPDSEAGETSKVPNQSKDSSDEFSVAECRQCVDDLPETTVDVQVEEQPTLPIEESGENDLRTAPRCPLTGALCRFYSSYFYFFTNPKCMLPVQLLLLAMPISCGLMAAHYMKWCPGNTSTPMLLFMIGVTATITIVCRMIVNIRILMIEGHPEWWMFKTITLFTVIILFLLLTTEIMSFFQFTPSFEFENEDFCDPVFYEFAYWMNWGFVALTILLCLLYVPACIHDNLTMQEDNDV